MMMNQGMGNMGRQVSLAWLHIRLATALAINRNIVVLAGRRRWQLWRWWRRRRLGQSGRRRRGRMGEPRWRRRRLGKQPRWREDDEHGRRRWRQEQLGPIQPMKRDTARAKTPFRTHQETKEDAKTKSIFRPSPNISFFTFRLSSISVCCRQCAAGNSVFLSS